MTLNSRIAGTVVVAAGLTAACSDRATHETGLAMTQTATSSPAFDYDRNAPLEYRTTTVEMRNGVSVHAASYADLAGGRITAYWVVPDGVGPFPAVLFIHPAPGTKDTFLDEAVTLAHLGGASLLIDAPWSQEAWSQQLTKPQSAYDALTPVVTALRRAVDVLLAQQNVDATRIGYVGHSFGALFGGVLSGVEKRINSYALLAGTTSFADAAVGNMPAIKGQPMEEEYQRVLAPIDPIGYVGKASPAAFLFQFGERDGFPREHMASLADAASAPKTVVWYDVDHYGVNEAGRKDRLAWLQEQLALAQ